MVAGRGVRYVPSGAVSLQQRSGQMHVVSSRYFFSCLPAHCGARPVPQFFDVGHPQLRCTRSSHRFAGGIASCRQSTKGNCPLLCALQVHSKSRPSARPVTSIQWPHWRLTGPAQRLPTALRASVQSSSRPASERGRGAYDPEKHLQALLDNWDKTKNTAESADALRYFTDRAAHNEFKFRQSEDAEELLVRCCSKASFPSPLNPWHRQTRVRTKPTERADKARGLLVALVLGACRRLVWRM